MSEHKLMCLGRTLKDHYPDSGKCLYENEGGGGDIELLQD